MPHKDIRQYRQLLSNGTGRTRTVRLTMVRLRLTMVRLVPIGVFIALTNFGFWQRTSLLVDIQKFNTHLAFLAIRGLAIAGIVVAALQPSFWVWAAWGAFIATSAVSRMGLA